MKAVSTKVVSKLRRYGLAAISCAVAVVVARPLDAPSSCFFLAVMVSSLDAGQGPGLLSVGLSSLAFDYFFLPPRFHLFTEPSSLLRFAVFLGAALLVNRLVEIKRREEESRRQSDAQYRTIADTAPDAIISIDEQRSNPSCESSGYQDLGLGCADAFEFSLLEHS
jgi:K+-sensing histidine kinase KdpD